MAKGNVDFFNDTGGYGFIETDDADDDVFFHMEDVGGPDLEEGTDIEFDIEQAPKPPRHQRHPPVIRLFTFGNGFHTSNIILQHPPRQPADAIADPLLGPNPLSQ